MSATEDEIMPLLGDAKALTQHQRGTLIRVTCTAFLRRFQLEDSEDVRAVLT